jgi:hypothetical protein
MRQDSAIIPTYFIPDIGVNHPMLNKNVIIGLTIFLMSTIAMSMLPLNAAAQLEATVKALLVHKATPLFGVDLPAGQQSPTFIQNVTQLAKMGFDSLKNAKLFLQLDSTALNSSSSHPGNRTLTIPTIKHITSI